MYYVLDCQTPLESIETQRAMYSYEPDDEERLWNTGARFISPPPLPIIIEIEPGERGVLLELSDDVIPLMSRRLATLLTKLGVTNLDFYETEIHEIESGEIYRSHLAFNVIGIIAAADLENSDFEAPDGPLISVDFDSLAIDNKKTREALMFRLAESVNAIIVHESVKNGIESAGINTLTFIPPEEWIG